MYNYNYRNCNCNMNNVPHCTNYYNRANDSALESMCNNISNCNNESENCDCGFNNNDNMNNNIFPTNPLLGQSYVPIQFMNETFTPCCGLKNGTIFPELVSPYYPCQSIEDIEYIRERNEIGKGCNA